MKVKVSIIIPCFNALPFVKDTLHSVLNQTYDNIETIIVDDGSTDGSLDYLMGIVEPNLIVKKNQGKGACAARNYGLELASGDFIQFLDADDLITHDKIENQVSLLTSNPNTVAVCRTIHFYDTVKDGIAAGDNFLFSTDKPHSFLLNLYGADGKHHGVVGQHAWLTPKSIIDKAGKWDETLAKDQDGEYFSRIVMQSRGVVYDEKSAVYYRKHVGGQNIANQKQHKHIQGQINALDSKRLQLSEFSETNAFKNAFALQYKILAIDAYPQYKDLYEKAIDISNQLGSSNYVPVLGGKLIEIIKKIFGWKAAILCRLFLHGIRRQLK